MASLAEERLEAGRLRVQFARRGDRYAHEIDLLRDGVWDCVLSSVEGAPDDAWPPSPPFQSLHVERRTDGRQVALLVGMAGKGHWSASVELDAAGEQARFEVACRMPAAVGGALQCCYQVPAAGIDELIVLEHDHVRIEGAHAAEIAVRFEISPQFAHGRIWRPNPTMIAVAPAIDAAETAQTVRWAYIVSVH